MHTCEIMKKKKVCTFPINKGIVLFRFHYYMYTLFHRLFLNFFNDTELKIFGRKERVYI